MGQDQGSNGRSLTDMHIRAWQKFSFCMHSHAFILSTIDLIFRLTQKNLFLL